MVSVRSDCGAINDARLQCLEALKLAIKLQTLSQYVHVHVHVSELKCSFYEIFVSMLSTLVMLMY